MCVCIYIYIYIRLTKVWTAINRLSIIWESDLSKKIKRDFPKQRLCQRYSTDAPNGRIEKKLDRNCTRMPRAILNKSWKQHSMKQQPYCPLPRVSKTIQVGRKIYAGHC